MTQIRPATTHSELMASALRRFPDRVAFRARKLALRYPQAKDLLARSVTVLRIAALAIEVRRPT